MAQPTIPNLAGLAFWPAVHASLYAISKGADTVEKVAAILNANPHSEQYRSTLAFFPGSGGDDTLHDALREAGWRFDRWAADYYYSATHPATGSTLTYIEGDVYAGDRMEG